MIPSPSKSAQYYLEKTQEMSKIGTWELNLINKNLVWSKYNYKNFGIKFGTKITYEVIFDRIHPDDRVYVNNEWNAAINGKPYNIEHRVIVGGKIKWLKEKADIEFDVNGVAISAIGFTQDITKAKEFELELKESQEKFSKSFYNHPTPMMIVDMETGVRQDVNDSYVKMIGFDRNYLLKGNLYENNIAFDKNKLNELISKFRIEESLSNEYLQLIHKSGEIISVLISGAVLNIGTKKTIIFSAINITEIEKVQSQLYKSENQFRNLVEQSPVAIQIFNPEGQTLRVNSAYLKLWGLREEALKKIIEYYNILKDERSKKLSVFPEIERAFKGEKVSFTTVEYDINETLNVENIEGGKRWIYSQMYPIKNKNGKVLNIVLMMQDITERKKAEQDRQQFEIKLIKAKDKVEKSEERFELSMNASRDGLYDWNLVTNEIYFSPGWKRMLGYKDEELLNDLSTWEKLANPHDVEKSRILHQELIEKKIDRIEMEIKMRHKNSHWVDILSRAHILFDVNGEATRMVGTHVDITQRKRAEKELVKAKEVAEENELKFKALYDNSPDMYVSVSPITTEIILCNDTILKRTGYSRSEIIGTSVYKLYHQNSVEEARKACEDFKEKEFIENKDLIISKKNGEKIYVSLNVTSIKNKKGEILYTLHSFRDISVRVRLEKEQLKNRQLLFDTERLAKIGGWELDVETMNSHFSIETLRIYGLPLDSKPPKGISGIKFYPEEARKELIILVREAIEKGKPYDVELPFVNKQGKELWVRTIGLADKKNGKVIRIYGTIQDITQRKMLEIEKEKLSSTVDQKVDLLKKQNIEQRKLSDELFKKNRLLSDAKSKFKELFEKSPVSIWEQDFSDTIALLNKKKAETSNLETYLNNNLDFVKKCISKIKIVDVNKKTLELIGVKNLDELVVHIRKTNSQKAIKVLKDELLSIMQGEKDFYSETEFVKTDGSILKAIVKSTMVEENGKNIASIVDITAITKAQNDLRKSKVKIEKSEQQFRELYEKSKDAILIIKNGIFVACNQATVDLLNYESNLKILNVQPADLSPEFQPDGQTSVEKANKMMAIAFRNGSHRFEWIHIKSDGQDFSVEVLLTVISNEPKNQIIHVVWRDITERKEGELKLIKAKEKAEESDKLKTEFLNNMSHEIRTPMNGILGFSEMLSIEGLTKEKRDNYVKIIQNSGEQLLNIIDDILEISALETKRIKVIEENTCLNELLFELFSVFDLKAKENNTPIYLKNGLSNRQSTILIDRVKLYKVISNLIENAIKFTYQGYIEFGYLLENDKIKLFVKDTGIGIEQNKQKSIFERFSQAEKDLSKKVGGLGLGLSIAKENTELLKGTIQLESIKGKGSAFYIIIPYKPVFKEGNIGIVENSVQNKYTILIAEDEEVNYLYLETMLKEVLEIDCEVIHALDGKEAIEICKENEAIDLVLMDL